MPPPAMPFALSCSSFSSLELSLGLLKSMFCNTCSLSDSTSPIPKSDPSPAGFAEAASEKALTIKPGIPPAASIGRNDLNPNLAASSINNLARLI